MDLAQLESDIPDTITVHLEFPGQGKLYDDDGNPSTIELLSPASDQAIEYGRKLTRKINMKVAKRGLKAMMRSTPEEAEQQNVERLCAYTASVNNLIYNGEKVTLEAIDKIYENPKMSWLCDQLTERLASWDDFLA